MQGVPLGHEPRSTYGVPVHEEIDAEYIEEGGYLPVDIALGIRGTGHVRLYDQSRSSCGEMADCVSEGFMVFDFIPLCAPPEFEIHVDGVSPCNAPPECEDAVAEPDELWPPDHKFEDVSVVGVTDPDGDPVTITITGVAQDEPPEGLGDGNTCPDADGIGTDIAVVRAERSGTRRTPGDGRVYHIGFTADDGQGGMCAATVTVCVPHDRKPGRVCVDQGPLFDSTVCSAASSFGRRGRRLGGRRGQH